MSLPKLAFNLPSVQLPLHTSGLSSTFLPIGSAGGTRVDQIEHSRENGKEASAGMAIAKSSTTWPRNLLERADNSRGHSPASKYLYPSAGLVAEKRVTAAKKFIMISSD